jgi:hypothetical protein
MRLSSKKKASLRKCFKNEAKFQVLEVAKPSVDELGAS